MSVGRPALWLLLLLLACTGARADEFRPAYLQLTQVDADTYDVLWRVPALAENTVLKLRPEFPAAARDAGPRTGVYASGAQVQRWRLVAPGGLVGQAIEFPGLSASRVDVLVRHVRLDGTTQLSRVNALQPRLVLTASPGPLEVVRTYTVLGVEHILFGFDHLLFVLALVLLVDSLRKLVATITAFTVAHSLTLTLASLGLLHVPGPPVEAAIALSIVFVAGEILHARQGRPGLTKRWPWLVAFVFGLLHGLGFASALAEIGLPERAIPLALLFFNIGVEIGQLLFVAVVLTARAALARVVDRLALPRPRWLAALPAYAIGGLASYWVFERVAAF